MITVTLACGHSQTLADGAAAPTCSQCRETRVTSVKAPAPRFRGIVTGPCAEFVDLPAQRVNLTEKT